MKNIFLISLILISNLAWSQEILQTRKVEYYFELLNQQILENLKKENALDDSLKLKDKYFEIINNEKKLTKEGIEIYTNTRMEAHKKVFKTWNYQEHVTNGNYIYVLYFSIAGFEDLEWQVVRFKKEKWKNQEKIDKELLEKLQYKVEDNLVKVDDLDFVPLFSNYDEMPKNIENIKLFIKNQYLVLERGNLYHSLFDLKIQKTILNFECPWCESKATDKESMNSWIKENLHNPIEVKINASH